MTKYLFKKIFYNFGKKIIKFIFTCNDSEKKGFLVNLVIGS